MQNFDRLTDFNKNLLLSWFWYNMSNEDRLCLMTEHPVVYNKACGADVMIVTKREVKGA